jgi:hypothetical protein
VRADNSRNLRSGDQHVAGTQTEGVGESRSLADALCYHPNRGAAERLHVAHHPMARTGRYDAIFDKLAEDQSSRVRLEPLLPALFLRRCFLSALSHLLPS